MAAALARGRDPAGSRDLLRLGGGERPTQERWGSRLAGAGDSPAPPAGKARRTAGAYARRWPASSPNSAAGSFLPSPSRRRPTASRPPRAASTRRPSSSPSTLPGGASLRAGQQARHRRAAAARRAQRACAPGCGSQPRIRRSSSTRAAAPVDAAPRCRSRAPAPSRATRPAARRARVPDATAATASAMASMPSG